MVLRTIINDTLIDVINKVFRIVTSKNKSAKPRILAGASVGIPPRQVSFDMPLRSKRYPVHDNATATLFMAMLSAFFPPGERFFVESVRRYRDQVEDPELKAAVSGFIGQEAIHGREHERLNEFFNERGIDTTVPEKAVQAGLWMLERLPARYQLACTTLMEHFTALLAEGLLTDEEFTGQFDPQFLPMWQWHALEELEHKSVAYDVQEIAGNDRNLRLCASFYVAVTIVPPALFSWAYLVAREGKLTDLKDFRKGFQLLLGRKGFVSRILPKMSIYSARSFHPNKHNTKELERVWQNKLFGKEGSLVGIWSNQAVSTIS